MAEQGMRERDLVLGPNEFAMILDETKGHVVVYVGPHKTSLSNTDRPVVLDERAGSFKRCDLQEATRVFPSADEGSYAVLKNPAANDDDVHPKTGSNSTPKLLFGRKINVPGPVSFPLWPGQIANVIEGHRLRSNQYLVVRVYNDEAAKKFWTAAVVKPQAPATPVDSGKDPEKSEGDKPKDKTASAPEVKVDAKQPDLTMGQLLVIKGTDVSFYMPPTGIEVVPDNSGKFVRDAVTLERLEYCILLDENGNKRFVQGPAVVFPNSTETFVEKNGSRKFQAIELNENMGIYIKVIADYKDGQQTFKAGQELFITGKEQTIYFPREEHAIVKYGDEEVHFAVAIPEGEARYVLDKKTGRVELVKGPKMFLADPRTQVVVRRVLDLKTVELWFPGNREALEYNQHLAQLTSGRKPSEPLTDREVGVRPDQYAVSSAVRRADVVQKGFAGEEFERRQQFTPPRVITLDTKFEGAVAINVWTGYAVQVVSKTGERRVVIGPQTELLEYDETLEVLTMSTGTPKTDDRLIRTVYLLAQNNKVSDQVKAETKDLVDVEVTLSYRVNFEGDPNKWFNVENYVKLLTEHLRSLVRNAVKQHGIEDFNNDAITIIRDTILGVQGQDGKRSGRSFKDENGMRVYDVEVLDVEIGDDDISRLLTDAQHQSVQQALQVVQSERSLETTKRLEKISQETAVAKAETAKKIADLEKGKIVAELEVELERITKAAKTRDAQLTNQLADQKRLGAISRAELAREKTKADQALVLKSDEQKLVIAQLEADVRAVVDRAKAFGPDVVAALQAFADKDLAAKISQSMAPLAILGGKSVAEVFSQMLKGTFLEGIIGKRIGSDPPSRG